MHLLASACAADVVSGTDIAGSPPSLGSSFPMTIGPEQAVAHHGWIQARERALSAVLTGYGLVLVLGAPGTGKTLLLQEIARTLRASGTDVLLLPRGDLVTDATEAGMAKDGVGRRRVVLIDEADRMTAAALDHLGKLGTCAFMLAGTRDPGDEQPEGSLMAAATVVRLAALPPGEVGAFVAARLAQSGLDADLLTEDAVTQLCRHSGGMPRMLNMLAGAALFLARAERAHRVEAAHVDQAAALRDGIEETDVAASAAPAMPGVIPCRRAEPSPSPATVPAAACLAATEPPPSPAGSVQAPRRRRIAALGLAAGVAAACVGIVVVQHRDHARHASPPMVAGQQAAAPPIPPAPAPQREAAAIVRPATATAQSKIAAPSPASRVVPPVPSTDLLGTAPEQPEPQALPSGTPAHVLVRYARGSADTTAWAGHVANTLHAAGLAVDALVPVAPSDARPGARYFFAEDQAAADAVLRAAGLAGKGTLADARRLATLPRPGLIELTVPPGQLQVGGRPQSSGDGRS